MPVTPGAHKESKQRSGGTSLGDDLWLHCWCLLQEHLSKLRQFHGSLDPWKCSSPVTRSDKLFATTSLQQRKSQSHATVEGTRDQQTQFFPHGFVYCRDLDTYWSNLHSISTYLQYIIKLLVVTLPHRVTSIYRSTAKGPEWCNKALLPANTWVDLQISKDMPRDIPSTPHISPGGGSRCIKGRQCGVHCTSSSCINQIVSSSYLHLEVERTILGRGRFSL